MIKVFIIHSGADYDYVKNYVEPFLEGKIDIHGEKTACQESFVRLLTLESKGKIWKPRALKKIKEAQVILFIMGKDADAPAKKATIGWEIQKASRLNKIILLHKMDPAMDCPTYFRQMDRFTAQEHFIAEHMELSQIKQRIARFDAGEYEIFSSWFRNASDADRLEYQGPIIEQYKLYQQSSEDLVKRRQAVNSFYQALNGVLIPVLITASGVLTSDMLPSTLSYFRPQFALVLISLVGFILDCSWIRLLDSYGKLNSAKMKVLNLLEQQLPLELYKVEWDVMTDRLNNKPYKSFTATEKWIPVLFCVLYLICIGVSLLSLLWH